MFEAQLDDKLISQYTQYLKILTNLLNVKLSPQMIRHSLYGWIWISQRPIGIFWFQFCQLVKMVNRPRKTSHPPRQKKRRKNQHNVKTVDAVARIFDRFVGQVCLEISRCCSESMLSSKHYYIHYEDYVKRFKKKNSFESFQRYTKKR